MKKKRNILWLVIILLFTSNFTVLAEGTLTGNSSVKEVIKKIAKEKEAKEVYKKETVYDKWVPFKQTITDSIINMEDVIVVSLSDFSERPEMDDVIKNARDAYAETDLFRWNIVSSKFILKDTELRIELKYRATKQQYEEIKIEIANIVDTIMPEDADDFEKIRIVNRYIKKILKYDYEFINDDYYSAYKNGIATCLGYSTLAELFFNEIGLESVIVDGYVNDSITPNNYHAWNLVKINDNWYHLDITYNDTLGDEYLLVSDSFLLKKQRTWEHGKFPNAL